MENVLEKDNTGQYQMVLKKYYLRTANLYQWMNPRVLKERPWPDPFHTPSLFTYVIDFENVYWSKRWDIPEINISLNFTKKAILNSLQQFRDQLVFNRLKTTHKEDY
jgi:hypothetical protein